MVYDLQVLAQLLHAEEVRAAARLAAPDRAARLAVCTDRDRIICIYVRYTEFQRAMRRLREEKRTNW